MNISSNKNVGATVRYGFKAEAWERTTSAIMIQKNKNDNYLDKCACNSAFEILLTIYQYC